MATVACFQKQSAMRQEYVKIMGRHGFLILWGKKKIRKEGVREGNGGRNDQYCHIHGTVPLLEHW